MSKFRKGQTVYDWNYGEGTIVSRSRFHDVPYPIEVSFYNQEHDEFTTVYYTYNGKYEPEEDVSLLTVEEYNRIKDEEV